VIKRGTLLEDSTQYVSNQLTFESSQQEVAVTATYTSITSEDSDIPEHSNQRGLSNDRLFRVNSVNNFFLQLRKVCFSPVGSFNRIL